MRPYGVLLLATIAIGGAIATEAAEAAVITYTDRAAFQAATGTTKIETFNSFERDLSYWSGGTVDVGDFTLSGSATSHIQWNRIDVPRGEIPSLDIDGTPFASTVTGTSTSFTIKFDSEIFAFGADFATISDDGRTTHIDLGLGLPQIDVPDLQSGFFGLTSNTAFSSLTFAANSNYDGWSFDNVEYGNLRAPISHSVPEPTSVLSLLALGSLLIGGGALKRK